MTTYAGLLTASANATLRNKVRIAVVIAAEKIRVEAGNTPNRTNRLAWAKAAFIDPDSTTNRMMWAALAQSQAVAYSAIIGAGDSAVQSAVDAAVDVFATGG